MTVESSGEKRRVSVSVTSLVLNDVPTLLLVQPGHVRLDFGRLNLKISFIINESISTVPARGDWSN